MREVTVCALPYFNGIILAIGLKVLIGIVCQATPFEYRSFAIEFSTVLAMLSFPGFPTVDLSLDDSLSWNTTFSQFPPAQRRLFGLKIR